MAELYYDSETDAWRFRQKLRSPYIDYCHGCFFVTFQVYHNKSALGAIVGEECVLNELGEAVRDAWLAEERHVRGLRLFDFQVMPNHFHALLRYDAVVNGGEGAANGGTPGGRSGPPATGPIGGPANTIPHSGDQAPAPGRYIRDPKARDLPYVIGLFKSWTTTLYHRMKAAGRCLDLGPKLWQESFYDERVKDDRQFTHTAAYIRNNPRNWNLDRFGAVTSFGVGNIDLLRGDYVAYLSSEGYCEGTRPGEVPMRRIGNGGDDGSGPPATVISTFTSYYERQVLEKCLRSGRRFIWICPGGINPVALAKAQIALDQGRALLLSPVAAGTGVNKQRANWCNQFIAMNARAIWVGHIRAGGSLETIIKGCKRRSPRQSVAN